MRVKKDTFVQLISNAKKAINKSTIESFEAIKMEVNGDILKVSGSSSLMTIEGSTVVESNEDFECAVFADVLLNTITKLATEDIDISIIQYKGQNLLRLKCNIADIKLPLVDLNNCSIRSCDDISFKECNVESLKQFTAECEHALDEKKNDYRFSSFYITIDANNLKTIALDGKRISTRQTSSDKITEKGFMVHGKPLREALRIINEDVKMGLSQKNDCVVLSGKTNDCNYNIIVSLVGGEYFNVDQLLNVCNPDISVKVDKKALLNILNVSCLFDKQILHIKKGNITINCENTTGTGEFPVNVENNIEDEKEFIIGLNGRYLKESIESLQGEEVTMYFTNDVSPVYVFSNENEMEMILPIKLR